MPYCLAAMVPSAGGEKSGTKLVRFMEKDIEIRYAQLCLESNFEKMNSRYASSSLISSNNTQPTPSRSLILILGTIILWRNDQTSPFLCASIHSLNNIDHLLLILQSPVNLIIITGPQIDHDMFIPEKEHDCARIVKFIHLVEIGYFVDINKVEDCKILAFVGDAIEHFVLFHPGFVPVASEADYHYSIIF